MDDIAMVIEILADALDCHVSTEVPAKRPERLVMVAQTGDTSTTLLHTLEVSLTCWGKNDYDARNLALSASHALTDAALDHPLLSSAALQSITRDEWTTTGQARYLAIMDLVFNV